MLTWTGRWAVSTDKHIYQQLKAHNKKDAIEEVKELYKGTDMVCVWIGRAYWSDAMMPTEYIVRNMNIQNYLEFYRMDGVNPYGVMTYDNDDTSKNREYLGDVTDEQMRDLSGRLNKAFRLWEKHHKLKYGYFVMQKVECIDLSKERD